MSVFPYFIDSDNDIIRIDDQLSELGTQAINQLRDAVFAIEGALGINIAGSMDTLADRLNVSLNSNGTIKASALTSIGLATLPIINAQVGDNAGIAEYKLSLDYTTSDLHTLILANKSLLDAVNAFLNTTASDLTAHISGSRLLSDGLTSAKHVLSHIDLNAVPSDSRDPFYIWAGLKDKTGTLRSATHAGEALSQINDDLTSHENATEDAHVASAISVDTSDFIEIPPTADTVQKVIDYLNDAEELNIGQHRAVQHAPGIPPIARIQSILNTTDGYADNVVPPTPCTTHVVHAPSVNPVDSNTTGDDIIKFFPTDPTTTFLFDSQFSTVQVGDTIRVNYGNSLEASFIVESKRYTPGVEWVVRINGYNLFDSDHDGYDGYAVARIDRSLADSNTYGVLALAAANSIPNTLYPSILGSVIVADPKGACALGLIFDPNQLDNTHYNLWLEFYPNGNPTEKIVALPAIDVTGNLGATPGGYTLGKIVQSTNDAFRKIGYNYRFIAFEKDGNFGIMLADSINKASFAIINGAADVSGTLTVGSFLNNVIDDITDSFDTNQTVGQDALGFGRLKAAIASPTYQGIFPDATAALSPTKIITPRRRRNYIVDGRRRDDFALTYLADSIGAWDATIKGVVSTGSSVEVTYRVNLDLCSAKLKPGKTIVVQPSIAITDATYNSVDYGRFIIKSVEFIAACGTTPAETDITVINGVHATGVAISLTSPISTAVKLFFSEDSVSFNDFNVIDPGPTAYDYHRYHEIFVNKSGNTFSHERARLYIQNSSSTLLRTDLWHITDVSPKLRGYKDATKDINKFIRLYITSYDDTLGEFKGYLGQRISGDVLLHGAESTGKKNVPTRFYDETNVDYIELVFDEIDIGPVGISIMPPDTGNYADIELFPSLALNDELFLIGSCEVNWSQPSNQNIIQFVRDKREYGSISASDFTKEAKEYIDAGNRLLHQNGIIRGYDFVAVSFLDNRQLSFSGGQALVNGNIVSSNAQAVFIPQISKNGTVPATVTWAVCVNEFGFLQAIVLTSSKIQWFAETAEYFIDSCTFAELVSVRKNLVPIYLATAHIASITIANSDLFDVRKFVLSDSGNLPLTIVADDLTGHFTNFNAVKNWINNFGTSHMKVLVRGNINVSEQVDLTGFDNPVIFEGDGGVIAVTSAKGFVVDSNVTLRSLYFTYDPSEVLYTEGDLVCTGNGCIYGSGNIDRVVIEQCNFDETGSPTQRPPYINFELDKNKELLDVKIIDNFFVDNTSSRDMAAIAIVCTNIGSGTQSADLRNVLISRNSCDQRQGIYITAEDGARPGLSVFNAVISENKCGVIGYMVSSSPSSSIISPTGLQIVHNNCFYIATLNSLGYTFNSLATTIDYGTGDVTISSNLVRWIHVSAQGNTDNLEAAGLKITNNTQQPYTASLLDKYQFEGSILGSEIDAGIIIHTNYEGTETSKFLISGNTQYVGKISSTRYRYSVAGIWCNSSAIITDNILSAQDTDSIGILLDIGEGIGGGTRKHIVTGNAIHRSGTDLAAYIKVIPFSSTTDSGLITNNFFDSTTIDGSSTTVVLGAPLTYIVNQNKNQTVTTTVSPFYGNWAIAGTDTETGHIAGGNSLASYVSSVVGTGGADDGLPTVAIQYGEAGSPSDIYFNWGLPLEGLIPFGAQFTSATINNIIIDSVANTTVRTITIRVNGNGITGASTPTTITAATTDHSLVPGAIVVAKPGTYPLQLMISIHLTATANRLISFENLTVTYVW